MWREVTVFCLVILTHIDHNNGLGGGAGGSKSNLVRTNPIMLAPYHQTLIAVLNIQSIVFVTSRRLVIISCCCFMYINIIKTNISSTHVFFALTVNVFLFDKHYFQKQQIMYFRSILHLLCVVQNIFMNILFCFWSNKRIAFLFRQ